MNASIQKKSNKSVTLVNMRSVNRFDISVPGVDPNRAGPVNTGDGNAVSGLNGVDEISVGVKRDRMGGLSRRHLFRSLLEFDNLFTDELTSIMDQPHRFCGLNLDIMIISL